MPPADFSNWLVDSMMISNFIERYWNQFDPLYKTCRAVFRTEERFDK